MVDVKILRKLLSYDAKTGIFYWKEGRRGRVRKGDVAGTKNKQGYVCIFVDRKNYLAHRLAWLYMYGEEPPAIIDHINGVRDDNRISNLREATHALNMHWASKPNKDSGYYGVRKDGDRWQVFVAGKYHGSFVCKELAAKIYNREAYRSYGENAVLNDLPFNKPKVTVVEEKPKPVVVHTSEFRMKTPNKDTGYYGVSRNTCGRWKVSVNGKQHGLYVCDKLAAKVYNRKAKEQFGDHYPYLNCV
jgi:hypothetical protein